MQVHRETVQKWSTLNPDLGVSAALEQLFISFEPQSCGAYIEIILSPLFALKLWDYMIIINALNQ